MSSLGVIFDLDGTLLNTLEDLANSMNAVLRKHGYPEHAVEEYKYMVGNGVEKLIIRALPSEHPDEETVRMCLCEFDFEYGIRCYEHTRPYEGIVELLNKLDNMGIKVSVFSNKPQQFTKLVIEKYFGLERFSAVFGARADIPKKPDPATALEISELTGIAPSQYIYVGDSGVDMETANAAGMYAVGALWGFRKSDELMEGGARKLISKPIELIEVVKAVKESNDNRPRENKNLIKRLVSSMDDLMLSEKERKLRVSLGNRIKECIFTKEIVEKLNESDFTGMADEDEEIVYIFSKLFPVVIYEGNTVFRLSRHKIEIDLSDDIRDRYIFVFSEGRLISGMFESYRLSDDIYVNVMKQVINIIPALRKSINEAINDFEMSRDFHSDNIQHFRTKEIVAERNYTDLLALLEKDQ